MKKQRTIMFLVLVGTTLPIGVAAAIAADDPVVGSWNVSTIGTERGQAMWLGVERKGDKYAVRFLCEGGSPFELSNFKFENPTIEFKYKHPYWGNIYTYTGTLKGDEISGVRLCSDGQKVKWIARRIIRKINATGKWTGSLQGDQDSQELVLLLAQKGDRIEGIVRDKYGTGKVESKQDNQSVTLEVKYSESTKSASYQFKIKGDMLEGVYKDPQGGQHQLVAHRQREWGLPIELFNGKNMDGWRPQKNPEEFHWKVVDGVMSNPKAGANIVHEKQFRNFKLHVEFKVPPRSNSGIYLRGRYEIQVDDAYGRKPNRNICGSIYGRIAPKVNACGKAGEWQTFDVTLIDSYVTLVHNGELTIDNQLIEGVTGAALDSDEAGPGPLLIQGDHGAIYYRKITLTPAMPIDVPKELQGS